MLGSGGQEGVRGVTLALGAVGGRRCSGKSASRARRAGGAREEVRGGAAVARSAQPGLLLTGEMLWGVRLCEAEAPAIQEQLANFPGGHRDSQVSFFIINFRKVPL